MATVMKLQIMILDLSMILIPLPRMPILAYICRSRYPLIRFFNILNLFFLPKVKFTELFMQKKGTKRKRSDRNFSTEGVL